jgi:hypothetical protein
MEVTEIILAKVWRLCQLSSRSFFLGYRFLNPLGLDYGFLGGGGGVIWEHAQKTPSYDTKMLLKVVFDKTAFVKFKIINNLKQKIGETH